MFSNIGKFKFVAVLAVAVLIVTVVAVVFFGLNGAPDVQIRESSNDVQVDIGSSYPGIIDMVDASIAKSGNLLNAAVTLRDPIVALEENEVAYFDMILILENEEDVLQTYELHVDANATGWFAMVEDAQTQNQQPVQLIIDGNRFNITTSLAELSDATQAEWNICSTYEKTSDNQIISSGWDFIPDQGLQTTVF